MKTKFLNPAIPAVLMMTTASIAQAADDWTKRISLSGLVEVEYSNGETYAGGNTSDIAMATMELGIEGKINNMMTANIVLLEEDDDGSSDEVDQAYVTYANPGKSALVFKGGRMAVPFGVFATTVVSDTLTLEMGETKESALQLGYEADGLNAAFYLFNGATNEATAKTAGDSEAEQYGINLGYSMKTDKMGLNVSVGYISSIGDSDGISGNANFNNKDSLAKYVGGMTAYLGYERGPFTLNVEYLGATDKFASTELAFKTGGAEPSAYNVDFGYRFNMSGNDASIGVSVQGSDEAVKLGMPESRYLAALSVGIIENTSLAFEWKHDKDYATADGGTGKTADTLTVQLATSF